MPVKVERGPGGIDFGALQDLVKAGAFAGLRPDEAPALSGAMPAQAARQHYPTGQLPVVEYAPRPASLREDFPDTQAGNRERATAARFKFQHTLEQRRKWERYEQAKRNLAGNPQFEPEEIERGTKLLTLEQMGFENPQAVLNDPNANPDGRVKGEQWEGKDGSIYTLDKDGIPVSQVLYEKTKQGKAELHENAVQLKLLDIRAKIAEETIDTFDGEGKPASPRLLKPEEIDAKMKLIMGPIIQAAAQKQASEEFENQMKQPREPMREPVPMGVGESAQGPTQDGQLNQRLEQELQRRVDKKKGASWDDAPRDLIGAARNVQWAKEDQGLPEYVGMAQALLRDNMRIIKRGDKVPAWRKAATEQAEQILMQERQREDSSRGQPGLGGR
ncbi:MAG: hypothetical protein GY906_23975 [bacterium]|nr:hypothetical protein [bacterium]